MAKLTMEQVDRELREILEPEAIRPKEEVLDRKRPTGRRPRAIDALLRSARQRRI